MTAGPTESEIMAELVRLLADFGGREYSGPIEPETWFFADLGLASIDAVVLAETLEGHFGRPLPFGEMMADLGRRAQRDIQLGELSSFLARHA